MFIDKSKIYSIQSWLYLYKNFIENSLVMTLSVIIQALLLQFVWMLSWSSILIIFGHYPVAKIELQLVISMGVAFMLISKYIRYLLFKYLI